MMPTHRAPLPELPSVADLCELTRKGQDFRYWYRHARRSIRSVCNIKGWDEDKLIDLLALTSPRVSVRRSIRQAMMLMEGIEPHDLTRSTWAAIGWWDGTGEIRGPKTSAFAGALKGNEDAVVLDVWMAKALGVNQRQFERPAVRYICKERINEVAAQINEIPPHWNKGWTPAQVQASIWAATVAAHGRTVRGIELEDELTVFDEFTSPDNVEDLPI